MNRYTNIFLIFVLLICYAVKLYDADFDAMRNNWMYLSSAILMLEGYDLYTDLFFHQHPYLPNLYYWIFSLTGPSFLLALTLSVAAVCVASIPVFLSKGKFIGTLFLLSQPVMFNALEIGNYSYTLSFFTWAWYLRNSHPVLSGLFLGVSSGFKSYTLLFVPLFFYDTKYKKEILISYCIGTLPIFYYAIRDWEAFYRNTVLVHHYYGYWCEMAKPDYEWLLKAKFLFHHSHNIYYFLPFFFISKFNKEVFFALYSFVAFCLLLSTIGDQYFSITMFFLFMATDRNINARYIYPVLFFVMINYITLNLSSTHNVKEFITFDWPVLRSEIPEFNCSNAGGVFQERFNLFYKGEWVPPLPTP